ncbi:GerMN domain-containing protein [Leucobacter sp. UCMA 4100]|uniref:LpqB family beta-propeller domain-containing protein n=1 Tax=Leucobacter sp. UCMA 4100 TaxID=2810534 RepID=UPI0022EA138D|nr:LpqB family beta-propeller domain-containing protein [Leucobacter sp. UCMA 4100]MDA3146611.1 GerMN domain-containing protein [Leucobacter sp. UCMA 4100]
MMTRRMRMLAATGVTLAALTLTSCHGIPVAGGVHQGLTDLAQAEQEVQYRPDSPMPDATQEEIVRGFLQAASSASNNYDIARQFLTDDYRDQWDPNQSVTIDEGTRKYPIIEDIPMEGEDEIVSVVVNGIASVDERGVLTQLDADESSPFQFGLQEQDGEWRIASAPNGVILDRATFLEVWSVHQLYFTGPKSTLVSDTRWFLKRATMGSHIINQLLAGPTDELTGVAVSSFPTGTKLSSDSVIIEGGTARIDFSSEFEAITEEGRKLVDMQLSSSLYALAGVSKYVVTVGGVEIMSGQVALAQTLMPPKPEGGTSVGVMHSKGYGVLGSTGITADPSYSKVLMPMNPERIVMSRDGRAAVVLAEDGLHWATPQTSFLFDDRPGLLEPTTDPSGYVWTFDPAKPEQINLWHPVSDNITLPTPELVDEKVVAMRLSPDGNRIAILVDDDGASKVLVTGVVRDDNGVPQRFVGLGSPQENWVYGAPLDIDWVDTQRVGVLSAGEGDSTRFTLTGPGLLAETRAGVSKATTIRGGGRLQLTYLLTASGEVLSPQGTSSWQRQAQDISVVTKRG